jgi:voltage-gated potassium channel
MPPRPTESHVFPRKLGPNTRTRWQAKLYEVIFGHDTPAGRHFDVALIVAIGLSVLAVMLESIVAVRLEYGTALRAAEWTFTILFTIEYVLRLLCVNRPVRYARSFFGVIDLMAILPTYLSLLVPGAQFLLVIRMLRFLRIFRILKLVQYLSEANVLGRALWASRRKILVFLLAVITLDTIFGALMYVVEGAEHGFDSIPRSIYWAIVTLTTVGYGDISPQTNLGQFIAAIIMIMGYAIIAVPTGIVTAELTRAQPATDVRVCSACGASGHLPDASFCRRCGEPLSTSNPASARAS